MTAGLPVLIQGGMGVGVSDWRLASAVSAMGQLGVVSGTALDAVMVRRLQLGDLGGHIRRALEAFPVPGVASGILQRYFVAGGKPSDARFRTKPLLKMAPSRRLTDLVVAANFVEVFLAKERHGNPVGINFLEKIQLPTLASLYGAMLAGVDYVLMGAGIPRAIPGALDKLAAGVKTSLRIDVKGEAIDAIPETEFDPVPYNLGPQPEVSRPRFIPIVSSHVLATMLARNAESKVDGFVIEAATAGGHNAPPRGKLALSDRGEPIYGARDDADLAVIRDLGLPFWLAGSRAEPRAVADALERGATGVQVGTAFAFCEESGLSPELKRQVVELSRGGHARVFTDPSASPTGFPFKVVELDGSLSQSGVHAERERVCDLGYLRTAYQRPDGSVGWRCASEPVEDYVAKGGSIEDTVGRKCLCNALMSNIGLGQISKSGTPEPPLVTAGDDIASIGRVLPRGSDTYTAADVITYLLSGEAHQSPQSE
jgi:nitronate monooxygenase